MTQSRSTSNDQFCSGTTVGTGAAINISCGFIPTRAEVYNVTDGDIITVGFLKGRIPFTSGGTATIAAGDKIIGATSGATVRIGEVILISGTWAGGDAAGTFLVDADDMVGTFTSENVYIASSGTTNDATITALVAACYKIDTATAGVTTTSALAAYVGSATTAKGFTIGSVVSESAKELRWSAWR